MSTTSESTTLRQRHGVLTPPTTDDEGARKGPAPFPVAGKHDPTVPPAADEVRRDEIEDNYIQQALSKPPVLPPFQWKNLHKELQWISFLVLTVTPALGIYGFLTTPLVLKTAIWTVVYYFFSGLGITAGYHRLWAHRAYSAKPALQYFLMLAGSSAVEGSIHWWSRGHRAHHRYTDTELDPYTAARGFFYSHVGWMLIKPRRAIGSADVSDLRKNPVVQFQHRYYLPLLFLMGFGVPTLVAGLGWGDWRGGFFYAGVCRLVFVHHATFCVNSLAHWLGEASFDNKHSPRDHIITALVTIGEGYHNFHHQFPADYRNSVAVLGYDPTKWFIYGLSKLGLAYNLQMFPENEIRKGRLQMQLLLARQEQETLAFPKEINTLPIVSWDEFVEESKQRALMVVAGIVHDVSGFMDAHPGGRALIRGKVGKDATTAFLGGVYDHSNAAQNLLATMRVAVIDGGYEMAKDKIAKLKARKALEAADAEGASEATKKAIAEAEAAVQAAKGTAETERVPNQTALSYIVPGKAYEVKEHTKLETNLVANRHGSKIGKFW